MLLLLLACGTPTNTPDGEMVIDTVAECLDHYTLENGYGYDDDQQWQWYSKSPQMIEDYYCEFDDRACDPTNILPREAAICVGQVSGMGEGDYSAELNYRGPDDTLIWVIEALTWGEEGSAEGWGGTDMELDAWNDHDILVQGTWDQSDCFT